VVLYDEDLVRGAGSFAETSTIESALATGKPTAAASGAEEAACLTVQETRC